VKLIPQMEQFIREVNATVLAYNLNVSQSSSNYGQVLKLSKLIEIIHEWAEIVQTANEQTVEFISYSALFKIFIIIYQ
jgi:hypothetical protein